MPPAPPLPPGASGPVPIPHALTWSRLQAFLAVHDQGSVRRAAEVLQVTPPAVSSSVAALEQALGVALLVRSGRGLVPTDAGRDLADRARSLLGQVVEAAAAVRDPRRGTLRLGVVATVSEYVLPPLLGSFLAHHPEVVATVDVLPRDELFARVSHHELDVVVAGRPPRGSGLRTRARRPNRLLAVAAPGEPPPRWLLTGPGSGTRETALAVLESLGSPRETLSLGTQGAAVAAARAGLGVTLAHEPAVRAHLDRGDLRVVDVPDTPLERPWHLCTTATPTGTARLFVRHVCDPALVGEEAFHTRDPLQG